MPNKPMISGERFGQTVVLEDLGTRDGRSWSKIRCDCGTEFEAPNNNLRQGGTTACWQCGRKKCGTRMSRPMGQGEVYGDLVVIRPSGTRQGRSWSVVRCKCGIEFEIINKHLRAGRSSCVKCQCEKNGAKKRRPLKIGEVRGDLAILEGGIARNHRLASRVLCKCGVEFEAENTRIRTGKVSKCLECVLKAQRQRGRRQVETGHLSSVRQRWLESLTTEEKQKHFSKMGFIGSSKSDPVERGRKSQRMYPEARLNGFGKKMVIDGYTFPSMAEAQSYARLQELGGRPIRSESVLPIYTPFGYTYPDTMLMVSILDIPDNIPIELKDRSGEWVWSEAQIWAVENGETYHLCAEDLEQEDDQDAAT